MRLQEVNLSESDLRAAIFHGTAAEKGSFLRAQLQDADFSHAKISLAEFQEASLVGANLHAVEETETKWGNADLSHVKKTDLKQLRGETWSMPRLRGEV